MLAVNLGHFSQICCELLNQYFGDVAGQVGSCLLRRGKRPLVEIASSTGLNVADIRKALAILVQHNLVSYISSSRNPDVAEYSMNTHEVYCLLRYPRYLFMIKASFGDEAEMLLEELISQGQSSASSLIFRASKRLLEAMEGTNDSVSPLFLYEKLQNLAIYQFISRCPELLSNDKKVPQFNNEEDKQKFVIPSVDFNILSQKIKENADDLGPHPDSNIIWKINCERFDTEMRNLIMVNAAARRVDPNAGELYHLFLQLSRQTDHPLTANELRDAAKKKFTSGPKADFCDQYLQVLSEDSSELLMKVGDAGGGQYSINYGNLFRNLACAILDSIVLEKFGSKAARLFRLTRSKQYLEPDQMQQLSMIPAKEAKMHSYRLLEQNFLQIRELRKGTGNAAPVKTFFLFHVDLQQVVRTALDASYKGLFNALVRREHELGENKRLLDKQNRVESILVNLREQGATEEQLAEVHEMITPPENELLKRIHASVDHLTLGQMQVDDSILILESYLKFNAMR